MTKYLMAIGFLLAIYTVFLLSKNRDKKKIKGLILIGPFVLGGGLYLTILLLTANMPAHTCDGAAIIGILLSFIFLGIGILVNLVNILYLLIGKNKIANNR